MQSWLERRKTPPSPSDQQDHWGGESVSEAKQSLDPQGGAALVSPIKPVSLRGWLACGLAPERQTVTHASGLLFLCCSIDKSLAPLLSVVHELLHPPFFPSPFNPLALRHLS